MANNNNGLDDDDRAALATISPKPPPPNLKIHSLNPQHRNKRPQRHHKHSLDEQTMLSVTRIDEANFDSSDQDFLPRTMFNNHARYDHCLSLPVSNIALPVDDAAALPEFTASGATGIFKAPIRAAVHPSRPPVLELRPHPLRETQVGRFLRTIGCTETQLWAGQESGVRFWRIKDAYQPGCGLGGRVRRGDEDAVPFYESGDTSPTLCMEVDHGNRFVWTGHKDGSIRSWNMDVDLSDESTLFKEGLSWSAHKGPVLALVISSYGDIWSGSEGGVIKIWPWETVEKSLSMSTEEARISSLLVERGFIDLRSQVTVNGVCNISSSDIKAILSDHARARVWCATSLSFSLWDARTKELIKVFNMDGQIENRADMPGPQDQVVHPQEDEVKVKFVSQPSKKEKSHNSFLQRSRNAIIGAAGAVRRVASRGASSFNEESKKIETMVLTSDGTIWSGCSNGLLIQWDSNGNRVHDFNHHPQAVLCLCTYGSKLWVGYASGVVQLLDLDGNIITGWVAHTSPVIKMAVGGGYVFSMAIHGGIRGWQITSPGPVDNILRMELAAKEEMYTRHESFKILVGTWNVGQGKPPHEGLMSWLGSTVSDVGIVVVGLQEVDMGAGFLAMSAAKETVGMEGSGIGQLWQDAIGRVLDEGLVFERVGSRQLAGLLIAIWVKKNLRPYVGDLDVAAVACGFGRTIGNKGGVGLRLRVHDRIICFVNCHLAAHLEAVNRRNADFDHIFRTMVFSRQTNLMNVAAAGATSASQVLRAVNGETGSSDEGRSDLSQADMVIFCGDFNYRLFGITYDEARDLVSQRSFDWLREKDQLRAEMKAGKVFQGMHEAEFGFPPTYKFDKYKPGLGGYDSGEKKRIPAWCDRVIYRDCRNGPVTECNLSCPIISSVHMYEACMDVTDSDHKPVRCKLNVRLARVDRSIRRKEFGEIMNNNDQLRTLLRELSSVPETSISTDEIVLQNQDTCTLCISNKSQMDKASIRIVCEGQRTVNGDENSSGFRPRGSFGFPPWLEINPACGLINPEQSIEILVHHADIQTSGDSDEGVPQNRCEDSRDKEVILSLQIRGCYSIEAKTHQIHVRHCYSGQSVSRTNSSGMGRNGSSHHRHDNNSNVGGRG